MTDTTVLLTAPIGDKGHYLELSYQHMTQYASTRLGDVLCLVALEFDEEANGRKYYNCVCSEFFDIKNLRGAIEAFDRRMAQGGFAWSNHDASTNVGDILGEDRVPHAYEYRHNREAKPGIIQVPEDMDAYTAKNFITTIMKNEGAYYKVIDRSSEGNG